MIQGGKSFMRMHNLMSYNQLAEWNHMDHSFEADQQLNDYYECLIECNDDQSSCKRICKEVFTS